MVKFVEYVNVVLFTYLSSSGALCLVTASLPPKLGLLPFGTARQVRPCAPELIIRAKDRLDQA